MANFDAQITDLVGGTIDQTACDQWATDACKDIIAQLPSSLQEKCVTVTSLNNSTPTFDLDGQGAVMSVTRLSADSGGYQLPCRLIPPEYGDLSNDSSSLHYFATVNDPVYWITSNSSDASTLFVKPTPTANQTANVYHITYPTVNVSDVDTIANFPDEVEYLVVLYAAAKQLLQYQSTMSSSWNSDITTALGAITTELNKADDIINTAHGKVGDFYTSIGDIDDTNEIWDNTNKRFAEVKDCLDNAKKALDDGAASSAIGSADYDVASLIQNEDTELVGTVLQIAGTELSRAGVVMSEINTIMATYNLELSGVPQYISTASGYISQATGYVQEATTRLSMDAAKYQWYGDQYAKIIADYGKGIAALKQGGE